MFQREMSDCSSAELQGKASDHSYFWYFVSYERPLCKLEWCEDITHIRTCRGPSAPTLRHSSARRSVRTSSGARSVQLFHLLLSHLLHLLHHLHLRGHHRQWAMMLGRKMPVETWPAFSGPAGAVWRSTLPSSTLSTDTMVWWSDFNKDIAFHIFF